MDVRTVALTADVSEAHRQVPTGEEDLHFLGCQVLLGAPCVFTRWGHSGQGGVGVLLLVKSRLFMEQARSVHCRRHGPQLE